MTGPETLLSRWSQLKRGPSWGRKPERAASAPPPVTVQVAMAGEDEVATARPDADPPSSHGRDRASLPSIESIVADTDIRSFLQSSVPADLTRTALRRAWISDPAIRDFIGIAENQWDFTDPAAIVGFGPLREADDVPSLLAQALRNLDEPSGPLAGTGVYGDGPPSPGSGDTVRRTPGRLADRPADIETSRSTHEKSEAEAAAKADRAAAGKNGQHRHFRHGGALPRRG